MVVDANDVVSMLMSMMKNPKKNMDVNGDAKEEKCKPTLHKDEDAVPKSLPNKRPEEAESRRKLCPLLPRIRAPKSLSLSLSLSNQPQIRKKPSLSLSLTKNRRRQAPCRKF